MALTFTVSGRDVAGGRRRTYGTLAFDSSYAAGGEAYIPANFELQTIDAIAMRTKNGYEFFVDTANKVIKVFQGQPFGVVNINTTSTPAASTTSAQTLMSYTLPGGTVATNGGGFRVTAWGTTLNNSNNKTIALVFGASTIVTTGAVGAGSNNKGWNAEGIVIRTGATAQEAIGWSQVGTTVSTSAQSNPTETWATNTSIIVQSTSATAATSDVVQTGMMIELFAPPGTGNVGVEVPNAADLSGLTGVQWEAWGI